MPKLRKSGSYRQVFTVPTLMATKNKNRIEQHNTNYKTFFVAKAVYQLY